jgi:Fe-S-cluster-containing dehydrogenase component/formate-dependent nitrite reductase membrane component NrfD
MNYGWVIDQTKCIGCHACSTACKSENDVPLGVHRTWVKAIEVGQFPHVRRHFAVLRCNHCADPPCVHICPVSAMHQRADGIVDIAHDRCIGCKACMQACPYDAIHVDPTEDTVAKCHFCAHRVDRGLLPACVVICPVEALVFGDIDDPRSRINRYLGSTPLIVRRPEQNTRPKAFYAGAHAAALDPLAAAHEDAYMWSERRAGTAKDHSADFSVWSLLRSPVDAHNAKRNGNGRTPRSRMPKARVAYDVHHLISWKGKVSSYLWTKSVAAGSAFVGAAALLFGLNTSDTLLVNVAPVIALAALAATGVLLVADLKRPERFWYILVKPQWRSWLTRGAYIITGFGAALVGWLGLVLTDRLPSGPVLWITVVLAFSTAVYTAFLFAQCEARDLWQSPLVGPGLTIQMIIAGSSALLFLGMFFPTTSEVTDFLSKILLAGLSAHLLSVLVGEVSARHGSSNAAAAADVMIKGRYAALFWASLIAGAIVPGFLLLTTGGIGVPLAAGLALAGLLAYEHAFVMSGQAVPVS